MRLFLLLTLAVTTLPSASWAARPLHVRVGHHHASYGRAEAYLLRKGILTREQLACSTLVRGKLGSARVSDVAVYERHGGVCPGDPQPPTFLFDLYVDAVSGVIDYTPEGADELKTILPIP